MNEHFIYLIETRTGTYMAIGDSEHRAKINFTISFPSEKIRTIRKYEEQALQISYDHKLEEYFA